MVKGEGVKGICVAELCADMCKICPGKDDVRFAVLIEGVFKIADKVFYFLIFFALLVIGSCLVFFLPHRRVWGRVRPNADGTTRVMLGAPNKRDPGMEPVFAELLHHIQDDDAQRER